MPHARAVRRAAEASVRDERHALAESRADDVARGGEHLLHAGSALRSFVADHHHVAGLHLATENAGARLLLRVEADGLAGERHHRRRHTALLHHRAAFGEVAPEHREAAVLGIGVVEQPDHVVVADGSALDLLAEGFATDRFCLEVEELLREALEDGHDAACAVEVAHVVVSARRELADVRRARGDLVHALERVVDARLARNREGVEHRVRGAAHRHVEREGVVERGLRHELAREGAALLRHRHGAERRLTVELLALRVDCENRAVAGQREAERLVEAVHGVRGEHAAARAAAGTRRLLHGLKLFLRDLADVLRADGLEHRVEVGVLAGGRVLSRGHRAARGEDGGDVHAQGADEHAGDDLVAVRHADERVETVRARDRLHAVRDQLAAGERVLHAGMRHRDAVADGDRVELHRDAARLDHALLDPLAHLVEVAVPRHERLVAVADADERLFHVAARHARGEKQTAVRRALHARLHLVGNHLHLSFSCSLSSSFKSAPSTRGGGCSRCRRG